MARRLGRCAGLVTGGVLAVQACGTARAPVEPEASSACVIAERPADGDTLTLVLDGAVDPSRAPVPLRFSERIAFAHFYETLLRIDCNGQVSPGLAAAWQAEDGGRRWRFDLREDAVFSDGTPVTARAVLESWSADPQGRPRPWPGTTGEAVTVLDDHALVVTLDRPYATVPHVFAHHGLAVSGAPAAHAGWPAASGPLTPIRSGSGSVTAAPLRAMGRDAVGAIVMRWGGPDPRDAIDRGFDVLVTRSPAVSAYAGATDSARIRRLAWDRIYVFLVPAKPEEPRALTTLEVPENVVAAATDADARPSVGPYWWDHADCALPPAAGEGGLGGTRRIVYRRDDGTARGLAERLVALAASGRLEPAADPERLDGGPVAAGLEPQAFVEAMKAGADIGYVFAVERAVLDPCSAAATLVTGAPWPARVVPLVDTRAHLVVRRVRGRIVVGWDGAPLAASEEPVP